MVSRDVVNAVSSFKFEATPSGVDVGNGSTFFVRDESGSAHPMSPIDSRPQLA